MRRCAVLGAGLKLMVFSTAWFILFCAFADRCLLKFYSPGKKSFRTNLFTVKFQSQEWVQIFKIYGISIRLCGKNQSYNTLVQFAKYIMDKEIFKNHTDYWQVADNIRDIYLSDGSLTTLLDFERVLDEVDIYAFKNWEIGELVAGPDIGKYRVSATFMWPEKLMPDPRGARRLLTFDCNVEYLRKEIKIPVKITDPSDYRPGTHKAKLMTKKVWLVEITMPKALMNDIRTGSIEMEDEDIDLDELDQAYEQDLDQEENQSDAQAQDAQQSLQQQPAAAGPAVWGFTI